MTLDIEAVYEGGGFKPIQPVLLKEHERVTLSVETGDGKLSQSFGSIAWTGPAEGLREIAESPELGRRETK